MSLTYEPASEPTMRLVDFRECCLDAWDTGVDRSSNNCIPVRVEAGSYLRLMAFVYHSTIDFREIKKKKGGPLNARMTLIQAFRRILR